MSLSLPDNEAQRDREWGQMRLLHLSLLGLYFGLTILQYFRLQGLAGPENVFVWNQTRLSRSLVIVMTLHLALVVTYYFPLWRWKLKTWWNEPGSPSGLAALRWIAMGSMLAHQIFKVPNEWAPLAALPHSARQPLPFMGWLIDILPISPGLYTAVNLIGIGLCFLALIGLWTRPALLALIPVVFYTYGVPQFYGKLSHYHYFWWVTVILAFSPAADVWSVDAWRRKRRGSLPPTEPSINYGRPLKWLMLTLAVVYAFSGIHKLWDAGLYWALSDNPVNLLRTEWLENFQQVPAIRIDRWPWLCRIGALGVILFEIGYPFLLLSKRGRIAAALSAVGFHTFNGYFLNIDFTYLKAAHWTYLDWTRIDQWWRKSSRLKRWAFLNLTLATIGWLTGILYLLPIAFIAACIDLLHPNRKDSISNPTDSSKSTSSTTQPRDSLWVVASRLVILLLLGSNTVAAIFGIHSWPISAYPSYSFVRGDAVRYGWFEPLDNSNYRWDLDSAAQQAGLRKENILPMAERIVTAFDAKAPNLEHEILASWERWRTEAPSLAFVTEAKVVIRSYPLDPDHYQEPTTTQPIGYLRKRGQAWIFEPIGSKPAMP